MIDLPTEEGRAPSTDPHFLQYVLARFGAARQLECHHHRDCLLQVGPGGSVALAAEGIGAVALPTEDGGVRGTELVGPGSLLGIARVSQPFPGVSLVFSAITDARLLLYDYEEFCRTAEADPAMTRLLFAQLQRRFLVAVEQCLTSSREADQAVTVTLHSLMEALDAGHGSGDVRLPVVRHQVAMLSGKSVPSTNRVLQQLRHQGSVRLGRGTITVPKDSPIASTNRKHLWQN